MSSSNFLKLIAAAAGTGTVTLATLEAIDVAAAVLAGNNAGAVVSAVVDGAAVAADALVVSNSVVGVAVAPVVLLVRKPVAAGLAAVAPNAKPVADEVVVGAAVVDESPNAIGAAELVTAAAVKLAVGVATGRLKLKPPLAGAAVDSDVIPTRPLASVVPGPVVLAGLASPNEGKTEVGVTVGAGASDAAVLNGVIVTPEPS